MFGENFTLPSGCILRPARQTDSWAIRKLVWSARLDPTQIRWQQFWVIECDQQVVACGQLRSFASAQELGSLVVLPQWRQQGLGSYLVRHLIQQSSQPLYLECLGDRLAQFYRRFEFSPVAWQDLPPSLKPKFGLSQLAVRLLRLPVVIMRYEGKGA